MTDGVVWGRDGVQILVAPTDHRPVEPTIGFRVEFGGASVVLAGDSVPCASLDALSAGADALVHTVIRKDLVQLVPNQRLRDILDYHSSVEQAANTAARAGVGTLILTHYVRRWPRAKRTPGGRWRPPSSTAPSNSATTCTAWR